MRLFQGQGLLGLLTRNMAAAKIQPEALVDAASQIYVKDLAIYTAVSLIADLLGRCERQVYRDGKLVRDENWYRWNVEANPNQSGDDLFRQWLMKYYYDSQALVVPIYGQLYVADSFATVENQVYGNTYVNVAISQLQLERMFYAQDVYYLSEGSRSVRRMVDGMYLQYSELLAAAGQAIRSAGGEKYAFQLDRPPSGTPEDQEKYAAQLRENLKTFVTGVRAAYPLYRGQSLTKLSGSGSVAASPVVDLRREVYNMVGSAIHLPESLLTGNMNNAEQILQQALTFAVDPLAHRIGRELTRKTFSKDQITGHCCGMRVDTSKLLHVDLVTMADKLDKLISSGISCIDEARRRGGLPELGTEWSRMHFITKNYDKVENTLHPLESR